tara:strand:+ start:447 stop:692 length:246 start_codon:yes stop_codon:yes gene_type:complete
MTIKSEKIEGKFIINEYNSTNLGKTKYNTETSELIVEFTKGGSYAYEKVPISIFTKMRIAESQGKYFSKNISKVYKYKKLT